MTYELIISAEAEAQLWESTNWYCERSNSVDIGLAWYNGIIEALKRLTDDPHRFELAQENDKFPYELHELHYGSGKQKTHRALFRVIADRVEVLAIRHHAQDNVSPQDF